MRQVTRRMLETFGYRVVLAGRRGEAVALYAEQKDRDRRGDHRHDDAGHGRTRDDPRAAAHAPRRAHHRRQRPSRAGQRRACECDRLGPALPPEAVHRRASSSRPCRPRWPIRSVDRPSPGDAPTYNGPHDPSPRRRRRHCLCRRGAAGAAGRESGHARGAGVVRRGTRRRSRGRQGRGRGALPQGDRARSPLRRRARRVHRTTERRRSPTTRRSAPATRRRRSRRRRAQDAVRGMGEGASRPGGLRVGALEARRQGLERRRDGI